MGHNAAVVVLHDALDQIEKDPEFGSKLSRAILRASHTRQREDVRAGCHANAACVVTTHHADIVSMVAVGGNHGSVMLETWNGGNHCTEEDQLKLLRELAAKYGYQLRKKPA